MFVKNAIADRCCDLAESIYSAYPNPRVGALVLDIEGNELASGFHSGAGQPHAEVAALAQIPQDFRGRAHTLVVSLEPCNHFGRTPPCTHAILNHGIKRVIYLSQDPNPVAAGGGEFLRAHGVEAVFQRWERAYQLNEAWFFRLQTGSPLVRLKVAAGIDGTVTDSMGQSQWITGDLARQQGHKFRAQAQIIVVGAGTVATDRPRLTARLPEAPSPLPVVWDPKARLDPDQDWGIQKPGVWFSPSPQEKLSWKTLTGFKSAQDALKVLETDVMPGAQEILVEGGPGTWLAFEPHATRLELFLAPCLLGGKRWWPGAGVLSDRRWRISSVLPLGQDAWVRMVCSQD